MMSVVLQTVLTGLKPNDQRVTETVDVRIFIALTEAVGFTIILSQDPKKSESVSKYRMKVRFLYGLAGGCRVAPSMHLNPSLPSL